MDHDQSSASNSQGRDLKLAGTSLDSMVQESLSVDETDSRSILS